MGQYYKFVNATKQEESTVALPFNFGLAWAKSLERLSQELGSAKFSTCKDCGERKIKKDIPVRKRVGMSETG